MMKINPLNEEERRIIEEKGTEPPFSGKYNDFFKEGVFVCKRCSNPLFSSQAKFKSSCGWPSFDEYFEGAAREVPDSDGIRTEIVCNKCLAHLGHVFRGENFTPKNTRHCVNSLSIKFIPELKG
ncbi:MAG: Peptide methionine sulfoxide reductase MsrB [candidate division WS2 bacterium ADurb.Bin280]|uniref:peptide-methionine (R)-S-oxide reductase n=1 Tax=candidate division WS2 bacterium ADurb.Bin280 TaxID=1852829 RepID=A0A1V5SFD2_9BACT|nr:MAG: Peptide methionine sulfoxide reductase MsrB [candidate division WS2 bacterium ADurb.Bin280]